VRLRHVGGQAAGLDDEAVVLAGDLDLAGFEVLDRVIAAAVTLVHLGRTGAQRQRQHLVPEANAKQGHAGLNHRLDHRHGILARRGGIAGTVGEEHAVRPVAQHVLGRRRGGHHRDAATGGGEAAQDVALDAVIDGDDVVVGRSLFAIARA